MATSGKCVITPDVGEPAEKPPAEQAPQDRNASRFPAEKAIIADSEDDSVDRSFLMTLLRTLSACHS